MKIIHSLKTNTSLGTHDSILALMVLPLILRSAPKKVELNSGPVTVTKQESSKCFILHIQVKRNVSLKFFSN